MGRLSELVAPRALDTGFRWLWGSSAISNLGDGVLLAAGPLLVASVTTEPIAVAAAVFLQRLPWLLFGVFAGALIDRLNRKWLTVIVDLGRAVVLGALAGFVATGSVNLAIIYVAMFLIGTAETFADNAAQALLATNVPRPELGRANARLFGTVVVTNQLAGPPLGALLFGVGMAVPFGSTRCASSSAPRWCPASGRRPPSRSARRLPCDTRSSRVCAGSGRTSRSVPSR